MEHKTINFNAYRRQEISRSNSSFWLHEH